MASSCPCCCLLPVQTSSLGLVDPLGPPTFPCSQRLSVQQAWLYSLPAHPSTSTPLMLPIHCCFIGSRPNSAWVPPHIPRFPFPCSSSKRHLPDKEHHPVSPGTYSCIFSPLGLHPCLSSAWLALPRPWLSVLVSPSPSFQVASTKAKPSSRDLILLSLLPALNWSLVSGLL